MLSNSQQVRPNLHRCLMRMVTVSICCYSILPLGGCSSSRGFNLAGARSYERGNYQRAIGQFQDALAKDPANADAYYNLASTYYSVGKSQNAPAFMQQAESLYNQCLDLRPDHVSCHRGLAALLVDTNRPESAFTLLKRWSARSQQLAEPRIELARLYEEFGDYDNATRHLTDALNVHPGNSRAWAAIARLRERDGKLAQALSDYQQAYNLNQRNPAVASRIASLRQNLALGGSQTNGASPATKVVNSAAGTAR